MLTLPGLIDPHTHPRGLPTDDYKEDFYTATCAALAGGFTTIFDMPNNPSTPTLTYDRIIEKQAIAKDKIVCDVGFFFGTNGKNREEFNKAKKISRGLKVFLSVSTGNLIIDLKTFKKVCQEWTTRLPILLHAEESTIAEALEITKQSGHRVHVCHVSSKSELQQILDAKNKGYHVTCGITPHHLFLTRDDQLGPLGLMKPSLKSQSDVDFLWKNITNIDVIESDHAPHALEEKRSNNPPFGITGLETTVPLLLTAMHNGKISLEEIKRLCHDVPAKIFGVKPDPKTYIEVDKNEEWTIKNENLFTKCKWTPFHGWRVKGKVKKVIIRGKTVFENGKIQVDPGFGNILNT